MRALLSVWDKAGLVELAGGLSALGVELVASGGTAMALSAAGVAHRDVAELTGFPEMLGGRVKTLHPAIHGGILADRDRPEHLADLAGHGIGPIDLVVCNLYPFAADPSIELIDVGGPTMVRAAAKNHAHVAVVTSPHQYEPVLEELRDAGQLSAATRRELARQAFAATAAYDAQIAAWLAAGAGEETPDELDAALPVLWQPTLERVAVARYGENPHQRGARYRVAGGDPWWDHVTQHAGTALSYLNLLDADAAWRLAHELASDVPGRAVAVIVKHANAAGAALADDLAAAYREALAADPLSAFGGVVALLGEVDESVAEAVAAGPQADVVVAGAFTEAAVERLRTRRKATRLLSGPAPEPLARTVRTIGASAFVQSPDELVVPPGSWRCVTAVAPTPEQLVDLVVAWRVCARTTSNAIVLANGGVAVGVGAGQQSRVVSAEIAVAKAGSRAAAAAAASDAFFPFADGLEALVAAGVRAVVQPGGSVRDAEVIAAADAAGIALLLTGERHFRH